MISKYYSYNDQQNEGISIMQYSEGFGRNSDNDSEISIFKGSCCEVKSINVAEDQNM
jgi:hypothetical protein